MQILHINLTGKAHMVIDVALVHDLSGDCWRDVRRNGQLCNDDPDMLLNNTVKRQSAEVPRGIRGTRSNVGLPPINNTSGRIHGEFRRILHILFRRQAVKFFIALHTSSSIGGL